MRREVLAQAGNSKIEALRKWQQPNPPTCNRMLQCLSIITDWLKEIIHECRASYRNKGRPRFGRFSVGRFEGDFRSERPADPKENSIIRREYSNHRYRHGTPL